MELEVEPRGLASKDKKSEDKFLKHHQYFQI